MIIYFQTVYFRYHLLHLITNRVLTFQSLSQESTVGVERWVGSVLLLLRSLITHSTPELVLARLEELGLSMDYVHSDVTSDTSPGPTPGGSEALSPQVGDHASGFRDPLNVTQPETLPQVAMAR